MASELSAGEGFRPLDEKSLVEYIKATPALSSRLGDHLDGITIKEVGDGNLNFVYIVVSPAGSMVIKQALPYIRCIGESWPMTKERAYFEARTLKEHGSLCPNHVPEVYHFDRPMSLIAMRYLEPPHIILRKGLIAGIEYPLLAEHISGYMAKTLFFTSLLYRSTSEHKNAVAEFCGNVELCRLTEQVVFSDPYMVSQYNHWTSPYLDHDAEAVRQDDVLKLEVAGLKSMFCERSQALVHGDLHTGSVMVTSDSTQVIDPEFAFYGPMGFDLGAFLGNLILAFFAQDGHANQGNNREDYKVWILRTIEETWNLFQKKFISLWDEHGKGDAYLLAIYNKPELQSLVQKKYMQDLFHDTLGFGAAKMISIMFNYGKLWPGPSISRANIISLVLSKPLFGHVKFNVDVACCFSLCSFAVVVRDADARFLEAYCGNFTCSSSLEAEEYAILMALRLNYTRAYKFTIIKSDALEFIQLCYSSVWPWKLRNTLMKISCPFDRDTFAGVSYLFYSHIC